MKIFSLSIFWRITTTLLLSIFPTIFLGAQDTTIILQPGPETGIDAMIYSHNQEKNYGDVEDLHSAIWPRGYLVQEYGLIKFDLSQIPEDVTILKATLTLYANYKLTANSTRLAGNIIPTHTMESITNASYLYRITSNWDPSIVTWLSRPSFSIKNVILLPETKDTTKNYTIDLTEFTQKFHSKELENYGFMLIPKDTIQYTPQASKLHSLSFLSSNMSDAYAYLRPKLEITYRKPLPLTVYELITPEVNDKNDFFYIESLLKYPENEVTVFNNWGSVVYHKKNYQNDWNGGDLPEGTYYYLVKLQGYDEELKGPLLIDR